MKKSLVRITGLLIAVYLIICIVMYFGQIPLTFPGSVLEFDDRERIQEFGLVDNLRELNWTNSRGEKLNGFEINNTMGDSSKVYMIYFGGNADDIWKSALVLDQPKTISRSMNYPGFATSEGVTSEENILNSAKEWIKSLKLKPSDRVTFVGRSLGSGVATQIAYWAQKKGMISVEKLSLVLVTPYDALWKVGRGRFPWLPVDLIMNSRLESDQVIGEFLGDLHVIISEVDKRVPHERTRELVASYISKEEKRKTIRTPEFTQDTIFKFHHNNILDSKKFKTLLLQYSRD